MTANDLTAKDFATRIVEGPAGMNAYEERECVAWHTSERVASAMWTLRCLANPHCEGSDVALAAIIEKRAQSALDKAKASVTQ